MVKWLTPGIPNIFYNSEVVDLWDTCVGYCGVVVSTVVSVFYSGIVVDLWESSVADLWDSCIGYCGVVVNQKLTTTQ